MANTKREALRSLSGPADAAYRGPVDYLETLQRKKGRAGPPFRMPVRSFDEARRDLAGTVASGNVKLGDEIVVLPYANHALEAFDQFKNAAVKPITTAA